MNPRPRLDISDAELQELLAILREHIPEREVWAFGSRARGTAKPFSDLDLAVIGEQPLSLDRCAALKEALADSDLPWKVDVVDWAHTALPFRKIIQGDKVVVQQPGSQPCPR